MNYLDIGVLVLVILCALAGYRRGLIRTVYGLVSFFLAIFLANLLFPYAAAFLRETFVFDALQDSIKTGLNLEGFVTQYTAGRQADIIESLPIPAAFRGLLHAQFEADMHGILRFDTIEDYVSAFFANIAVNGIALVLVFMVAMVLLSVIGGVLDIVGRLPVINTFNRLGGLAFGVLLGVGISWLVMVVLSMFLATSTNADVYDLIMDSVFGSRVFERVIEPLTEVYNV
ncbi:MAG: CvpA family protein [Defluviitaleaceae bacterium]|nr:CvpA family protein [Defluviitaleaceae bacterium]